MPLSIFKRLGLGEARPTNVTLQLAGRSLKHLGGLIEDILVKVDKFIFPIDFIVLNMEEDKEVPIILGRPFLATSRALIDVESGELTLRIRDDKVCLSIYRSDKLPKEEKATCMKEEAMSLRGVEIMQNVPKETPLKIFSDCSSSEEQWGRKLNSSIHPKVYQNEKPIVREVDLMHFTVEGIDKPMIVKKKKKKHLTSLIPKDSISACFGKHESPIIYSPG